MKYWLIAILLSFSTASFASGDAKKGKELFQQCQGCHGTSAISNNDYIPNLACQNEGYLIRQFYNFKSWRRAHGTMSQISKKLKLEDMRNISAYLNSFARCSLEPEIDLETMCSKMSDRQTCVACCFKFD